jgi:hypothetical protein
MSLIINKIQQDFQCVDLKWKSFRLCKSGIMYHGIISKRELIDFFRTKIIGKS